MAELKNPKYLKGLKELGTSFKYKVSDNGQYFIDYDKGFSEIDNVVEKLKKLSTDLNTTSEDVKKMLSSYMLDDTVDLNGFVVAVNGSMNSMASEISKDIQTALHEAKDKMEKSKQADEEYVQKESEVNKQFDGDDTTKMDPYPKGAHEGNDKTPQDDTSESPKTPTDSSLGSQILANGEDWLGTPYQLGGESKSGIDCSALTQAAAAKAGITLPRTTGEQIKCGTHVDYSDLQPGDLIFTNGGGHVVIYAGTNENGDMMTLGASSAGGEVQYVNLEYQKPIYEIRRIY